MPREVVFDAEVDLRAYERIVEQRRTHTDCRSTSNQKLDRIICGGDAALPDDWHIVRFRDLVKVHLTHGKVASAPNAPQESPTRAAVKATRHNNSRYFSVSEIVVEKLS